jgi:nifR3 family TIM-barrel protein
LPTEGHHPGTVNTQAPRAPGPVAACKRSNAALKLGPIELDVPFFQASLSGYSDYAMRSLARRFGCPFTLTDVILAKSAAHPHVLRKACFRPHPDEHPIGAQILGRSSATMAKAAKNLVAIGYDLIDLNYACPAPKVLRRQRGGALLSHPGAVIETLRAVQDVVTCPILMKLRIGLDHKAESRDDFWEIVTRSIEQGVDALVIHGRTVAQRYRDHADWDILARVKQRFPDATIIASGDVFDPATAAIDRLKATGLDGFIVARGAIGNPWIFRDLRCAWEGRPLPPPPDLAEQRRVMLDHVNLVLQLYPERKAICYFRKFIAGYARRHPQRKNVLRTLMTVATCADLQAGINTWYPNTPTD